MSDKSTDSINDQSEFICSLGLKAKKPQVDPARRFITNIICQNGIGENDAGRVGEMLGEILLNITNTAGLSGGEVAIDIELSKRLHSLVVEVEDKGLPLDYEDLSEGKDQRFSTYLAKGYVDEIHFECLGPEGNRVEIVKYLPSVDVRREMEISEHQEHLDAAPAPKDEEITIGLLKAEETVELVRLLFKCYGYSYPNEFMYYPDQIRARIEAGTMTSCGAYNPAGELVGHLALIVEKPGDKDAESGEALVDNRYRGHGIFKRMKRYLKDFASGNGIVGIYGEAVTVHPYSQKGSLDLGAKEIGFLLGYSPGSVSFRSISDSEKERRQSVALMYTPVLPSDKKPIYLKENYTRKINSIIEGLGFERELIGELELSGKGQGRMELSLRHDHNQAFIKVLEYGENTLGEAGVHLKHLCVERVDCIYADLPVNVPGSDYYVSGFREMGFFFGAFIPDYRDGDILRLQYLNNVEILRDDIKVASDFGESLLDLIFSDYVNVS